MGEEILKLRNEGKTYNEIQKILGCSKSTISYYCGEGQREKVKKRTKRRRENKILSKVERFKYNNKLKNSKECIRKFQKTEYNENSKTIVNNNINLTFTWVDVLEKYGEDTKCYLSGIDLNLLNDEYSFDHIKPISRGGDNSLENLGITHKDLNRMKTDFTLEELLFWCEKILVNNGYEVVKK